MHCGGKQKYLCVTQVQLQRNPRCSIIPQPPAWLCCSLLWQLPHTSRRPGLDLHLQIQGKDSGNSGDRTTRCCCCTDWQKHPEKGKMGRKGQRHLQQRSCSPAKPNLEERPLPQAHLRGLWAVVFLLQAGPSAHRPRRNFLGPSQVLLFGEMYLREGPTLAEKGKLVH